MSTKNTKGEEVERLLSSLLFVSFVSFVVDSLHDFISTGRNAACARALRGR